MNAITKKTCATCRKTLAADAFRKVPTIFGGDGYSKDCKDCGRAKRAAKTQDVEVHEPPPTGPHITLRPSLGFRAHIDSDGDLVITQMTDDLGEQSVWLSVAERAELVRFIASSGTNAAVSSGEIVLQGGGEAA